VVSLTSTLIVLLGVPVLLMHLALIALTRALRSYYRSRLEEYCEERGQPRRAAEVGHMDERTERASEAIAVLSGLFLVALIGVAIDQWRAPARLEFVLLSVILVAGLGYILAGVLGRVFAEPILYHFWPASPVIRWAAWPATEAASLLAWLFERLLGDEESWRRPASVEVEIPTEEGENSEDIEAEMPESTRALIQRVVELGRTDVSEVMIPASAMVRLPATVTAATAAETFRRTGRSRIPLYGTNRDDIVGILIGKDLWEHLVEAGVPDALIPARLARPAFCIPESRNALQLIDDLRRHRTQMAIVLNEYGAVAGLVTLEDLLEQLVGPIDDEHDVPTPPDPFKSLGGTRYEVDAALPVEELNERFDLHLPTEGDFHTVGGLALHVLGRVPEMGTTFRHDGVEFTIVEVRDHWIRRVRIDLQPAASNSTSSTHHR
jgi:CBS domain containing-hemolysin-like protein